MTWLRRLWRWLRGTKRPLVSTPKRDPMPVVPPAERPPMHLVFVPENRPLCGASVRQLWTIDPAAVTCQDCRREGEAAMLQWFANNR